MGKFFFAAAVISLIFGSFSGNLPEISAVILDESTKSVELSLKLLGSLCFWSGVMKIAEKSGMALAICGALCPALEILFPKLKKEEKALGLIGMNLSANMLGLGNAATPLGINAMKELSRIGGKIATKETVIFTVMNTASIQLLPTTVAALRLSAGAKSPLDILPAVWFVSALSLLLGIAAAVLTYPKGENL